MPGYSVPRRLLKNKNCLDLDRYVCSKCELLLKDPVLPCCGHRLCKSCADGLPAPAKCPRQDCKKDFVQENGEICRPDDSTKQEIRNLQVICPHFEAGCRWEGKLHDYHQHKENCDAVVDLPSFKCGNVRPFRSIREQQENDHCCASAHVRPYELEDCKNLPHSGREQCPISSLTPPSTEDCYQHEHHLHMQESDHSVVEYSHLTMMANCRQLLTQREIVPVPASDHEVDMAIVMNTQELNVQQFQVSLRSENEIQGIHNRSASFTMQELEDAIVLLNSRVAKLKEKTRFLNTKLKKHNFRLSLVENSNHDGTMIWKISQFGQRKADAENGRSTSLFSLPFYSGRYGYKMCLRLYIMGDGIGKGTHLSLFFVVMRGEFDNILQWPFTYKVTFKLINQVGGEDIVDTLSNSFRKPISDMNISSGCPRFVSHTELERSGLIVEDTIFIKCIVDTATIKFLIHE